MNANAIEALSPENYNNPGHFRTRKLVYAFWAIQPKTEPDLNGYEYSEDGIMELQEHTGDAPDGPYKPKLMCDPTFMELQTASSEARDANGLAIPIDPSRPNGEKWKLKDWEEKDNWYFWYYSFVTEHGYIVLSKRGYPALSGIDAPWPIDPRTGQPSTCMSNLASTLFPVQKGDDGSGSDFDSDASSDGGMDSEQDDTSAPWSDAVWIILCPSSFRQGRLNIPATPPQNGAILDDQEITALTFDHEVLHIADPRMDDFDSVVPLPGNDMSQKSHFLMQKGRPTLRGIACMILAKWEAAEPVTESYEAQTTLNPESYAWASFALWLQGQCGVDFSSGLCSA
ncbi:hypothetical protein Slin15195_G002550 [Septoria linicola]|uniref:Uncharacterized protein n=1 Tax=Septoria linicola TaxID=215465 RepID=A0A9Q9ECQ0_9PEZI|nr:hypothetical protein Slin15195_G002550 [Septoria linicola]